MIENQGYIQVYTGNGKGKTTAALGSVMRAIGAGKKVLFAQFVKKGDFSEIKILNKRFPEVVVYQFGNEGFIVDTPSEEDICDAVKGLETVSKIIADGDFDMVVLDEINIALYYKLISVESVVEMLKAKDPSVEIIMTGRYFPPELIEIADLVTDMQNVKHFFDNGVGAREGIEY